MKIEISKCRSWPVIIAAFIAVFCLNQSAVFSANPPKSFYVAKNGNDSNPGTLSSPVLTIAHCVSLMTAGDTCFIRTGIYTSGLGGNYGSVPVGTSFSNAITIKAYNNETVTITCPGCVTVAGWGTDAYPTRRSFYWIIDGLIIDATHDKDYAVSGLWGDYIRIQNTEVRNSKRQGMLPEGCYWELLNLNVHDNGTDGQDHGLYWDGKGLLVDGGSYYNNQGLGIHIFHSGGNDTDDNVIRNTRIYNNGLSPGGGGIILSTGHRNIAYNNLIYNNSPTGLEINYRCVSCAAYNNTVYGNTGSGINVGDGGGGGAPTDSVLRNNLIYSNSKTITDGGVATLSSNNLTSNPSFTNAAAADFTLQASSIAIGAGVNLSSLFTTDFSGKPRSATGAFDVGAFTYASATADTTAPIVSISVIAPQ